MKNIEISLTCEERELRKRKAFEVRGVDYDEYCRKTTQKKIEIELQKQKNIERNMYHKNHEDDIQFGCCSPDTLDPFC